MKTGRQRKRNRWFRNYQEKKKVWLSLNPDKDEMWIDRLSSPAGRFWPVRVKRLVSLFLEDLCQIKTDG